MRSGTPIKCYFFHVPPETNQQTQLWPFFPKTLDIPRIDQRFPITPAPGGFDLPQYTGAGEVAAEQWRSTDKIPLHSCSSGENEPAFPRIVKS
jgi:hypothetical protein